MKFKPISYMNWPKGVSKRIALLDLQPEEIEQRYNIQFTETSDEFDYLKSLVIETEAGEKYALCQFRGSRRLGIELWVPETAENIDDALSLFFTPVWTDGCKWCCVANNKKEERTSDRVTPDFQQEERGYHDSIGCPDIAFAVSLSVFAPEKLCHVRCSDARFSDLLNRKTSDTIVSGIC